MDKEDLQKYLQKSKDMDALWCVGNDVLYDMCRKYPAHKDATEVVAKLFLIGRSYAAAIERTKNDNIYEKKIPKMVMDNGKEIDVALNKCKSSDLAQIFSTYDLVLKCFNKVSGKWNKSLASKYLHFHQPENFYLIDSRAKKGISVVLEALSLNSRIKEQEMTDFSVSKESKEYVIFYLKCQKCVSELEELFKSKFSTRDFDNLLLTIADSIK